MLEHIRNIAALIRTLIQSDTFHAFVVQSPPGWAKSTTIDEALTRLKRRFVAVGSYATPLHIYNTLCDHPDSIVVLDDCAGLFSDPKSMAILKSATWQSSGYSQETAGGLPARRVSWGSTSEKVTAPYTDFRGKIILLTNVVPTGSETEAFLSRCLSYRIRFERTEVKNMLRTAACSKKHFPKTTIAKRVVAFLCDDSRGFDLLRINLRTLKMGYDLILTHPKSWEDLFAHLLPKGPRQDGIADLFVPGMKVKEQEAKFQSATGKSRRTYYYQKRRLGLTRSYGSKKAR